jgi:hypothetical protein
VFISKGTAEEWSQEKADSYAADSESSQQHMEFEEVDPFFQDGVPHTVRYLASGLIVAEAPETETETETENPFIKPGEPSWVSYTMKFTASKPLGNLKVRNIKSIKVSPHSAVGKALVKKAKKAKKAKGEEND